MLPINEKFEKDIQRKNTFAYPLIIIDQEFYISTVREIMKVDNNPIEFQEYGLVVSSIKESIDIEEHSFRTSDVTLSLNNFPHKNGRASDNLINKINKYVEIYYKSQSCESLEDCLFVYKGSIKTVTHDESTLSITLEDSTDIKLHKDVPIANLGFSKNVFNKDYINRSIPITYGAVQKAPVIPWIDTVGSSGLTNLSIIADDCETVTGSDRGIYIKDFNNDNFIPELHFESDPNNESFLYIYKGDYLRVLQQYNDSVEQAVDGVDEALYSDKKQYSIDSSGQFIKIEKIYKSGFPENPPASNQFQTVTLLRPNQAELLRSESGVAEDGNVGSIINIDPPTGILRPEASIDSNDNPTIFFDTGDKDEFTTFSEIPNSETTPDNVQIENNQFIVNLFRNYNTEASRQGIWSPLNDTYKANYLWLISSWLQTNAHLLNIRFINAPSGNMVITKADEKLIEMGLRNDGEGQIFKCYDGGKVLIQHQYALSEGFRDAWIQACPGITGDESESQEWMPDIPSWAQPDQPFNLGHEYFPNDVNATMYPRVASATYYASQVHGGTQYSPTYYYNNSEIFGNQDKEPIYPQTVYKIECDVDHPNNNPENPDNPIRVIYVGQWDEATMGGALQSDERWINLFYDEEYPDKDYLFEANDFATFTPYEIKSKHLDDNDSNFIGTKYGSYWNGVDINTKNGTPFNEASDRISNFPFAGGYGQYIYSNDRIEMDGLCGFDFNTGGNSGGQSWWMIIDEPISSGNVCSNISGQFGNYLGEFVDDNCKTSIKKGTLIPCNCKFSTSQTGINYNYDYIYVNDYQTVNLTVGSPSVAEQRLSLFFPFSDIESSDALTGETSTFVFGSLNINLPVESGTGDNPTHLTDVNDDLLVQAYAVNKLTQNNLNYNSEFTGSSEWATNLIKIAGNDAIFNDGGEISWDIRTFTEQDESINNQFSSLDEYKIPDWDSPDTFNALALVYRLRSDNPNIEHRSKIKTNISTIGLLQYSVFENVFESEFYADVLGRSDEDGFYTGVPGSVISNPADVLYHLVDKELNIEEITDLQSLEDARLENVDINLSFSVKEKINSKELIQEIAKNSRLFPKFNFNGDFSFANIKNVYNSSDMIIKQDDVISFSFTRTPSSNIKTLVNVKYRKDYATDEFKRETGYCDGYDFFGNSEDGREVYKNGEWGQNGYNYNALGLNREGNIFEFESNYIRDYSSAIALRNYIYLFNCNQHTIVKCTLPLKYMKLEVGDIIEFDKLNNNVKAFGEDYTQENIRNGQKIYKYFIINSINKSSKNIKLECMQLHELVGDFTAGNGSVSRRSTEGVGYYDIDNLNLTHANAHITYEDLDIYESIMVGEDKYLTANQKLVADLTGDGSIDQMDTNIINTILDGVIPELGDVNLDGEVNVIDIVAVVGYILDGSLTDSEIIASDVNQDGITNITDMVALINMSLED